MVLDVSSAGIVTTLIVFVIGFLTGAIVKKAFKLGIAILALLIILAATGYYELNLQPNQSSIQQAFQQYSPSIISAAREIATLANILPIASTAFLIGLAIGIWKG